MLSPLPGKEAGCQLAVGSCCFLVGGEKSNLRSMSPCPNNQLFGDRRPFSCCENGLSSCHRRSLCYICCSRATLSSAGVGVGKQGPSTMVARIWEPFCYYVAPLPPTLLLVGSAVVAKPRETCHCCTAVSQPLHTS